MPRCVNELCLLLGYSRQAYYQGIKSFQEKEFEAEIIIAEVLRIRKTQKHIGTRKLLHKMHAFLASHGFKIGRARPILNPWLAKKACILCRSFLVPICFCVFLILKTSAIIISASNSFSWNDFMP